MSGKSKRNEFVKCEIYVLFDKTLNTNVFQNIPRCTINIIQDKSFKFTSALTCMGT